jgi:Sulfotransferase family
MIISHKYKFIFIKTNKTAGTSIEIALSRFCGDSDIITPIPPEDEVLREKLGYRGPQNYVIDSQNEFYNHVSAAEIKSVVGPSIWNEYYKFCFERNPWDRVISFFYWRTKNNPNANISNFINSDIVRLLRDKGLMVYTIDNQVAVDRVYLYENLKSETKMISNDIGLPETMLLPFAKAGYRKDTRNYSEILSEADIEKVRKLFSIEIDMFGY